MTQVNVKEARRKLCDLLGAAYYGGQRTIISRCGRPMAALVSLDDLRLLLEKASTNTRSRRQQD